MALALLLLEALPDPDALCEELPPLPPVAVLVALPELPEVEVELAEPSDDEPVDAALPVLPDSAEL